MSKLTKDQAKVARSPTPAPVRDELGELLIEKGLAASSYTLDSNRSLQVPYDMVLPAPWNLPSRLFRFPIEVGEVSADGGRRIGLMHPLLGEHPFVQRVAAAIGVSIDPTGAPNRHGVSKHNLAEWWHAVDLIGAGKWRELLETRHFTTEDAIARAVTLGLDHSNEGKKKGRGFNVGAARSVLAAIGAVPPADRLVCLRDLYPPSPCKQDTGRIHWAINPGRALGHADTAWGRIFGIEAGWFERDRSGFLQWSQMGRDLYGAGGSMTCAATGTGQLAFAF